MQTATEAKSNRLSEIAFLFFKLGCLSFGGPAAHIAMMEDEVVRKRKWMSESHFLDLIGATNLIPGPNSTEMTMHCGHERAGRKGMVVAGVSFIIPAVIITALFAYLYQTYGALPDVTPFIFGIKPAVIAIIINAAFKLGKKAITSQKLSIIFIVSIILCVLQLPEVVILFGCGLLSLVWFYISRKKNTIYNFSPIFLFLKPLYESLNNTSIFLSFLKIGAILYGSGYVLFAFLDSELVSAGYLSRQALIDAVAVGQITPGPVLSTATFIGWQLNGYMGAIAATLGIFLPSFIFVLLLNPIIPKLRKSEALSALLNGVNVAAVALIAYVCFKMGQDSFLDWRSTIIAVLSIIAVFKFKKLNSAFIVISGSLLGYFLVTLF
ncbi:MAG: chromate transporter [Bacteroidetes bacterium MedPE-SWsnd-G2]|nr:MAG: chromate transporter [Bacteroidetes bacterium MedPE-SWsnd-G2]